MDLEEFEMKEQVEHGKKTRCQTCNLPPNILEQIHAGRERMPKPVGIPTIVSWLEKTHQINILPATLTNHFRAGHHK